MDYSEAFELFIAIERGARIDPAARAKAAAVLADFHFADARRQRFRVGIEMTDAGWQVVPGTPQNATLIPDDDV